MVVARGHREEATGSYGLIDTKSQFYRMKRALEMDGSDGSATT